jgi:hypothetical protein
LKHRHSYREGIAVVTNEDVWIFLSYAHDDDLATSGLKDEEGFVSYLHRLLELKLRDLGAQRAKIWRDRKRFSRGDQFDKEIDDALTKAEILIVLMSPNWLQRPYCIKEFDQFFRMKQSASVTNIADRMVVVSKGYVDVDKRPSLLRSQEGFAFYERDEQNDASETKDYFNLGKDMRDALARHIQKRVNAIGEVSPEIQIPRTTAVSGNIAAVAKAFSAGDDAYSLLELRVRPGSLGFYTVDAKLYDSMNCNTDQRPTYSAAKETTFQAPSVDFRDKLINIQKSFARSLGSSRTIEGTQGADIGPNTFREIGTTLFDMLFNGDVRSLYETVRVDAVKKKRSNLVRIRNDAPELSYIPWELLFDRKSGQHLSCYQYLHLTRSVEEVDLITRRSLPITILGMAARPKTLNSRVVGFIDADREQRRITDALADLESEGLVDLFWTQTSSVSALSCRLDRPPRKAQGARASWDVFHFIGHGGLDEKGSGYLIVQEDGGSGGKPLSAEVLCSLLARPDGPDLVVLSSCSGAQAKPGELFSDTASALVRAGVSAVLAMQAEISDDAAILFMAAFYNSLASNHSLQHALTEARNQLRDSFPTEWATPVLYLHSDGRLFQVQ